MTSSYMTKSDRLKQEVIYNNYSNFILIYIVYISDLESIKMIGRKLLSQKSCIPTLFEKWLNAGVLNTAFEEMERWDDTILKIYKKREFIEMNISTNQIYKESDCNG